MSQFRTELPSTNPIMGNVILGVFALSALIAPVIVKRIMFPKLHSLSDFCNEPMSWILVAVFLGNAFVFFTLWKTFRKNRLVARSLEISGNFLTIRDLEGEKRQEIVLPTNTISDVKMSVAGNVNGQIRMKVELIHNEGSVPLLNFSPEQEVLDLTQKLRTALGLVRA